MRGYKCSICDYKTGVRKHIRRHCQNNHKDSWDSGHHPGEPLQALYTVKKITREQAETGDW